MTTAPVDPLDAGSYRVYLLRMWRDHNGPWHASLQPADAAAPCRFADIEALVAYLRELVPPEAQAPADAAAPDWDGDGLPDT